MTSSGSKGVKDRLLEYWRLNRAEALRRRESWQHMIQRLFTGYVKDNVHMTDNKRMWKQYEDSP